MTVLSFFLIFSSPVALYLLVLKLLLIHKLQRFALYAHKFNTLFLGDNLASGESFGFLSRQVTPFIVSTHDGEKLFAWHILPLNSYIKHGPDILEEKTQGKDKFLEKKEFIRTKAFGYLTRAERVVVVFHGNAGHVAQSYRPGLYRSLINQANTHVLAFDYRGFGHSTGSPTESGLIADGISFVNFVLHVAGVPAERIILLGHSLGTGVASAVALYFADSKSQMVPTEAKPKPELKDDDGISPTTFAGVVLIAPFYNLPLLLLTYRIGGCLPILLPLRPIFPWVTKILNQKIVDRWRTADRLAMYYGILINNRKAMKTMGNSKLLGGVHLIHSRRDWDISFRQSEMICARILGADDKAWRKSCVDASRGPAFAEYIPDTDEDFVGPNWRVDIVEYGGHNKILTFAPVAAAVLRIFG
ncbi:alpha/beta-hydrolase [Piedraia hortae CBS 480.64]|uniref:Alpha/beta-hydrolase n=1 Tax=Piedraia hortae CBS 480.64 TaxID=1314780 RepID=A0A6A7C8M9_9PEZI|nr:alpha/beta-hydrolase [Piedraia hortae CBS 480.64]